MTLLPLHRETALARTAAFIAVREAELAAVPPSNVATPDEAIAAIEAALVMPAIDPAQD